MPYLIRPARVDDAGELLAIYAPFVTDTTVSFETEVPSVEEFRARVERGLSRSPTSSPSTSRPDRSRGTRTMGRSARARHMPGLSRYRSTSQRSIGGTAWAGRFSARSRRA